jgi:hypothetical protein
MISMHLPKGKKSIDLTKEISSASNIKNMANRKATLQGLNKIKAYI